VSKCVDSCRLSLTRDHESSAARVLKILDQRAHPGLSRLGHVGAGCSGDSDLRRDRVGERRDIGSAKQQSMIAFVPVLLGELSTE
jgi:hypothetical protein